MAKKKKLGFKKLQWRLVLVFLLLILSVLIIAGTFLLSGVMNYYHNQFEDTLTKEFSGEISQSLNFALKEENPEQKIIEVMEAYKTTRLGINEKRSYYILDGKTASMIHSSEGDNAHINITSNILASLRGEIGNSVSLKNDYMDFSYPLKDDSGVEYIIYIKDSKQDVREVTKNLALVVIQSIFIGALMAMVLGVFLSRTISGPIINLTKSAGKMAEGNFDASIEPEGDDEIGILTNTFNYMAQRLKNTLSEISGEKDKIEVILKNMADGIVAFDLNGKILHMNHAAERMFDVNGKNLDFDSFFSVIGVKNLSLDEIVNSDAEKNIQIKTDDAVINVHIAPYKVEKGTAEGVIAAFQDVTKQQKLDDSRRAFVADVSHELRTPITNIKSYSETLLDAYFDDEETRKSFLKVINSEADRMTRLVKDLLVLSQLDYSKAKFRFEEVDIREFLEGIMNAMRIEAKNRNMTFEFITRNNVPEFVELDRDRMNQVITNVISNAFKYTKDGGHITVILSAVEKSILISVIDTGIGIPEKDIKMVFERFYRVDKARSRAEGGTGLGLAIAREIVKAHSGNITLESEYNKGTTVIITLPVTQENTEE